MREKIIKKKMILLGLGLAAVYWIIESVAMVSWFHRDDLVEQLLYPDIHELWMRAVATAIIIAFGVYAQYATNKRQRVEMALRESEKNFRNSLDSSPLGIHIVTALGETLYANQALLDICGCRHIRELKTVRLESSHNSGILAENQGKRAEEKFGNPALSGREISIVRGDGEVRHLEVFCNEVMWGGETQFQVLYEDITRRKRTEEQLQHSQLLASLGEMTAGIAHEVNNPLGSILLYSELQIAGDIPAGVKKDLRIIHDEARRATKIMTDLLTYGHRVKSQMHRLDLRKIIKQVLDMRRYQQKMQSITVSLHFLDAPLYVKGDSSQLMQVFMNLIMNAEEAVKGRGSGNILVTTRKDGEWAKVSVSDDGVGIPEEHLKQVFYPFFTTKPVGEGSGLGLSTCYGIITSHNGMLRAENNEMGGATFIVELSLV